jgi:O-antigen/teichoic acid export membrane protein
MALRRAVIASVVQQFATLAISFVSQMVLARLLAPREVGVYSVSLAMVALASSSKDLGVGHYVVTDHVADDKLLGAAYGLSLVTSLLLSIAILIASWPVAALYKSPEVGQVLRIIAFAQPISPIGLPAALVLIRELRFDALRNVAVGGAICQAALAIFLAYEGWSSLALGWAYFAGSIASAAGAILYKPHTIRLRPTLVGTRRLLSFGGWMTGANIIGSASMQIPDLIIGRVLGLADDALYSRANSVTSIVRKVFYNAVMGPVLPSFGEKDRKGESLAGPYLRIIEAVTGCAWPAYAMLVIWAHPLIVLLYGANWAASAGVVAPLAVSHGLQLAITPHYDVFIVKRRVRTLFLSEACVFAFTLCVLPASTFLGLQAAGWSLAVSALFFVACYYRVLKPVVGFRADSLFKVWRRSLIITGAVGLVAGAVRLTCPDYPLSTLLGLALSAVLGGAAWLITVMLIGHEFSGHIEPLLKRMRSLSPI